jgi:GTP-binding protein Era
MIEVAGSTAGFAGATDPGGRQGGSPAQGRDDRRKGSEAPLRAHEAPLRVQHAGFVSLVGRPNSGKSTLLNRLVGEKLAIVSPRPQTTRNRITGIRNLPGAQVVFVDTPGLHTPSGKLGAFMRRTVERALEDVDLVCVVADVTEDGHPDAEMLAMLGGHRGPTYCVLNKVDRLRAKARLLPLIGAWQASGRFREIVPVSALDGTNTDHLLALIVAALPAHPSFFPPDATSDQPETFYVGEVIREKIFLLTHEEVPYAVAVRVEELTERAVPEALYIRATIFVERDSQKGIVIGRGGGLLKRIGTAARRDLETFFGIKVYLALTVQVRRQWRKDARALREFGFLMTS